MSGTIGETPVLISPSNLKTEPIDRPHSPESNCAICLEEFTNKSFTNSCLHQFCYNCLKEWSKIKPECPLCKQRFHTIIYNVRSLDDFDEYHVNTPNIEFDQTVFINFAFPASPVPYPFTRNALEFRRNPIEIRQRMVEANLYHTPMTTSSSMLYIRGVNDLIPSEDTSNFRTGLSSYDSDLNPHSTSLTRYRREIYHRGRWVRPSQSSRVRQSSPEFYRLNPAQTHRLVPWLTRELNVLLDVSIDPQNLVQDILTLITIYHIRSRHFREAMRPHLGDYTEHFVHEFYNFAVSPHDIFAYDIMAEYGSQDSRPHRLAREESSESDSDVEVVNILRGNVPVGMDLTSQSGPSTSTSGRVFDTVIEISDSSDSDHEVEIVGMIQPVTPETILIESSGDETIEPKVDDNNCTVKSESPANRSSDSVIEQDSDDNQACSSKSVPSSRFKGGFISTKKIKCTSPSHSSSSSSSSSLSPSSASSESSPSCRYTTSPLSDTKFGNKRVVKFERESSATRNSDSIARKDFDPHQPSSSKSDVSSRYIDRFSNSSKESSSSSSATLYSSSLSSVSDSDYGTKRSSHKRKRKKNLRRERVKRRRRRVRIQSSSSDEEFNPRNILKLRLRSVVVKADDKSNPYKYTDSDSD